SNLYSEQLLLCLPELWDDITFESIESLLRQFTNSFSFYSFLSFTYKYLEIDIIDLFFNDNHIDILHKKNLSSYFKNIVLSLYKDHDDYFLFDNDYIGVTNEEWLNVKNRLLLDKRVKPVNLKPHDLLIKLTEYNLIFNSDAD
ncbi:MAG: hypothetical protein ACK4UK_03125, partial [Flavobacterium sp.]